MCSSDLIGSVIARACGPRVPLLPAFVSIPHSGQLGQRVHYATAGALGAAFDPIESGIPPTDSSGLFNGPPDLNRQRELSARRLEDRLTLLRSIDGTARREDVDGLDKYHRHALEILSGGDAASAFDLKIGRAHV